MKLRGEGLVDRITLAQAGRTRVWSATGYGARIAAPGRSYVIRRPLDWIPEVHHPLGSGEAVIPDALVYYRTRESDRDEGGAMLRAFVEVDRATMGPERLAAKVGTYARLYRYIPVPGGRYRRYGTQPAAQQAPEAWRKRYPIFPRLLFVLDATGPAGIEHRVRALRAVPMLRESRPPEAYTWAYTAVMSDAMIRVPSEVRDRLAVLAESRGTSIRSLVQEFAETTLTDDERRERADRTRAYLAEHFGVEVTDEESADMGRKLRDAFSRQADTPA
ncbi:replication-relaxation family protein [Streptomyces sp. NPDC006285]|uniref:replication-relaxation family protein n=1 Tax=Streptomyces sp. NPDC006285 TaxID=3364742 RepID=UPI0036B42B18